MTESILYPQHIEKTYISTPKKKLISLVLITKIFVMLIQNIPTNLLLKIITYFFAIVIIYFIFVL
jgi:hypothetical protein